METIEGVILILSCQKHRFNRMEKFKLPKTEYENWKVIYVLGDLSLNSLYSINGNILTINCEDSYLHLMKKFVMSLDIVFNLFTIKQGVLRAGDDLLFNEKRLLEFLSIPNKKKYMGWSPLQRNIIISKQMHIKETVNDNFMVNYYKNHPEDFDNPLHNLKNVDINKYTKRPKVSGAAGVLFFINNESCKILINKMKSINMDIFHYDIETSSYPYIIEDCAVAWILLTNGVSFYHCKDILNYHDPVAHHTNYNK